MTIQPASRVVLRMGNANAPSSPWGATSST